MRASLTIVLALLLTTSILSGGCDRDDPSAPADQESQESADERQDIVIYGGDLELTLHDVERAVERMRLLAPGAEDGHLPKDEPDWMKMPRAQIDIVQNLAHFRIVRLAAAERDIEITAADETAFLADHERLRRFLPLLQGEDEDNALQDELDAVDLSLDDIRHLVHDMILAKKLQEALAEEFSEEQLWAIYQQTHDEADLIVVRLHNTPASHEIDRAVDQYDAEIRAHYRDNRSQYITSPQVYLTILKGHSEEEREKLQQAAEKLAAGEESPAAIAENFGFTLEENVSVTSNENPAAHRAEIGDIGVLLESRRGPYAWHVTETSEPRPRSLDRPLRREIASRVLREQEGITPSNRERAEEAQAILAKPEAGQPLSKEQRDALIEELAEAGFEAIHTDIFSLPQSEVIPKIGLAENVVADLKERDLDDPVTDPVLDRNAVYVARIIERNKPDRQRYEEEREEFRERFLERNQERLVDDYVRNYQREKDVQFNTRPLAQRYGVYEKTDDASAE